MRLRLMLEMSGVVRHSWERIERRGRERLEQEEGSGCDWNQVKS